MTDLRIPERYLNDRRIMRLTPVDFTSFVMASLWSVSNRTDGQVEREDVPLIPMFSDASIPVFVNRGLWINTTAGWEIADYSSTQTSKHDLEVLENARRADREKKARQRAEKRASNSSPGPSFSSDPRDSPRDVSPGGHRTGQAGQDQVNWFDEKTGEVNDTDLRKVSSWDVAPIPSGRACPVCLDPLPADYPLAVCVKQDDAHAEARASSRVA